MEQIQLTEELSQNFIDFSYEANSQRAFPDARDGLKPGQRACLWEMYSQGYTSKKPHVKSAKIAGAVTGNWWPHGDVAIYDTFARMSQPWLNNMPEVDWHGENGSQIISAEPAAARYTEARMSKATEEGLLSNMDKDVVPMIQNYLQDAEWPEVFPALMPRLMINGSQGIGVTIAQTWLPHNPKEVCDVIEKYIRTGELDTSALMPDFPCGGIIINKMDEIQQIYKTGKGKVVVRAKTEIDGNSIIITEFPYQVYIENWLEDVKKLISEGELTGIDDIMNQCGRNGIRVEVKCEGEPSRVLVQLFAKTDLQKNFNANQFALVSKTPELLTFKRYCSIYLRHQEECLKREFVNEITKAQDRKEIVDGLLNALASIDDIIAIIRSSDSAGDAKIKLVEKYHFTEAQVKAILAMRLSTLTKLDGVKLEKEKAELIEDIEYWKGVLQSEEQQKELIAQRLAVFNKKYCVESRKTSYEYTEIVKETKEKVEIIPEDVVVVTSQTGDIKRIAKANFKSQRRGGKGVKAEDAIMSAISTNTVDDMMIFTNRGRMYRLAVDKIPVGTSVARGVHLSTLIKIEPGEKVEAVTSAAECDKTPYIVAFTKNGLIKKTAMSEFADTRKTTGVQVMKLREGDDIVNVELMNEESVLVVTQKGMSIRFATKDIAATGRAAMGVKSIGLADGDSVLTGFAMKNDVTHAFILNKSGQGKLTEFTVFQKQGRGGKGVKISGGLELADVIPVTINDNILIIGKPTSICVSAKDIPVIIGRDSIGVKIIDKSVPQGAIRL